MALLNKIHGLISVPIGMGLGLLGEKLYLKAADLGEHLRYPSWDATIGAGFAGGLTKKPGLSTIAFTALNFKPILQGLGDIGYAIRNNLDFQNLNNIEDLIYRSLAFTLPYLGGWLISRDRE